MLEFTIDGQDMAPVAAALKERGAEAMVLGGLIATHQQDLLHAMEAIEYRPKLTTGLSFEHQIDPTDPSFEGRYYAAAGVLPLTVADHPEFERFESEMALGRTNGLRWLDPPYGQSHFDGWFTAQAVIAILQTIKDDVYSPDTFTEAARAARKLDMAGLTAPWTPFEDADPVAEGRQASNGFYVVTVKDGAVTLLDGKLRCGRVGGCPK
jgi:hypothetical protein